MSRTIYEKCNKGAKRMIWNVPSKAWLATYFELPHPQLRNPKSKQGPGLGGLASWYAPVTRLFPIMHAKAKSVSMFNYIISFPFYLNQFISQDNTARLARSKSCVLPLCCTFHKWSVTYRNAPIIDNPFKIPLNLICIHSLWNRYQSCSLVTFVVVWARDIHIECSK